jgi:hypothetical protein
MYKNDLKQEFPKTPDSFHNKVEFTLAEINGYKKRRLSKKSIAVLALAAVLTLGSVTAMASGLFQWNQKVADSFGADKELQDSLVSKGVTEQKYVSVTDKGLTIDLVQTLQDKKYFYALFEVTTPKDVPLNTAKDAFEDLKVGVLGQNDISHSISGGFKSELDGPQNTNKGYNEIWINKKQDFSEKEISVQFKNLQVDSGKLKMNTILEGDWLLKWKMSYKDSTKYYDLNKKFNLSGYDVLVKTVELSPLSMTVYFDEKDIKSIVAAEKVNLDELDSILPICFKGVKYNDATVVSTPGGPGEEGFKKGTGEYKTSTAFNKVIKVENVKSLLFGVNDSEVELSNN